MSIDERLERLVSLAEFHNQQIESNSRQIESNSRQIESNSRQIAELREIYSSQISELREANALLVQMVSQQQDELREYKKTTNAALDRIDRTLRFLVGQQGNGSTN